MKSKVENKIKEMTLFAKEKWNLDASNLTVFFDCESSRMLGYFEPKDESIHLNINLLNEYKEIYIDDVVVHEFCHYLVFLKYPTMTNGYKRVMPHGREFKAFCSWFGNDGKATSSLFNNSKTLKKSKRKRFSYGCECGTPHLVSTTIHNRIQKGQDYRCKLCNSKLVKKEKEMA